MRDVHRLEPMSAGPGRGAVLAAWERFVQGEDHVPGVRPEVAISWHRCREQYRVDPHLAAAPVAVAEIDHTPEHDVVFAELGFRAASVAHDVGEVGGVVTVTDSTGRILAEWGDPATLARAADANLAPWFCWSECAVGTNGMGTALEAHGPVLIRGAEHWCQAFHNWVCAGIAVRDVVTKEPIAVLNISCWRTPLPAAAGGWLANAATKTQCTLRRRARNSGAELVAAYTQARARSGTPLAAMDTAGKVVIADETASVLMGVPASTPAVDPTVRWNPGVPELIGAARYATRQAARNPDWVGSTQIFTHLARRADADQHPTRLLLRSPDRQPGLVRRRRGGAAAAGRRAAQPSGAAPPGDRDPRQPDGAAAAAGGLVRRVGGQRRVAVHRPGTVARRLPGPGQARGRAGRCRLPAGAPRYVVNLSRVREIERGRGGELSLVMDDGTNQMVPVSRRNAPVVRRALAI